MNASAEMAALLAGYECMVTYQPLRSEVDFSAFMTLPSDTLVYPIPARASLDPLAEARSTVTAANGRATIVLLPGRKFDACGTRHGQGGGWYDRFLAEVPRDWLRIGFCFEDQFSPTPLLREPHDQPVDYVVVVNRQTGEVSLYSAEGAPT